MLSEYASVLFLRSLRVAGFVVDLSVFEWIEEGWMDAAMDLEMVDNEIYLILAVRAMHNN